MQMEGFSLITFHVLTRHAAHPSLRSPPPVAFPYMLTETYR